MYRTTKRKYLCKCPNSNINQLLFSQAFFRFALLLRLTKWWNILHHMCNVLLSVKTLGHCNRQPKSIWFTVKEQKWSRAKLLKDENTPVNRHSQHQKSQLLDSDKFLKYKERLSKQSTVCKKTICTDATCFFPDQEAVNLLSIIFWFKDWKKVLAVERPY